MTSADKLGMIVAVAVVVIFVGIGVGMSGVSEPVKVTQPVSDRPDVQQQSRDPSIPKEPPVISRDVQIEREVIPEARDTISDSFREIKENESKEKAEKDEAEKAEAEAEAEKAEAEKAE